jgi:hypothetical protein
MNSCAYNFKLLRLFYESVVSFHYSQGTGSFQRQFNEYLRIVGRNRSDAGTHVI